MKPYEYRSGLTVYGNGEKQYSFEPKLPTFLARTEDMREVNITAWKPSFIEVVKIVLGFPVFVRIVGVHQPQMELSVSEPEDVSFTHGWSIAQ